MTRTEHPAPAVLMHQLHAVSFFALVATGLYIAMPIRGLLTMSIADAIHFVAMYVFILTSAVRVYWAFFGKGSANLASVVRVPDYQHFAMTPLDWRTIGAWLEYYLFIRQERPYTPKYSPLQKITYGYVFPLIVVIMALTGFAMYPATRDAMGWFAAPFGGQNGVRLIHLMLMWLLSALVLAHIYLAFAEDLKEVSNIWLRFVPERYRLIGDFPADEVPAENRPPGRTPPHDPETR